MALDVAALPTLYQYYAGQGIHAGLSDKQSYFTLNNKNITIYSGAFHYFRVPRPYWRDRLRRMKAAGLNTVETYIPWNLHEPHSGVYDFGKGGSEMEDFLHVEEFVKTAKEEDLLVLIRTGPYIDSEWDFGGLPSWLTRFTKTNRNSQDAHFLTYVKRYFNVLLPMLALLQFQKGGAIVGFQIENEYANTGRPDLPYLQALHQMFLDHGIVELLFTCDSPSRKGVGGIPGVLQTANYNVKVKEHLDMLISYQPHKPIMTMEYWTGWFDHWLDNKHNTVSVSQFKENLKEILDYPSSVNMYMFIGSTNFGFLNGATMSARNFSDFKPDTTSYDYDSPITEYGAYGPKYSAAKELIAARNKVKVNLPSPPKELAIAAYSEIHPTHQMNLAKVIDSITNKISSEKLIAMESLPINGGSGQSFGYVAYRKTHLNIPAGATLKISGYVRDTLLVLVNGELISNAPRHIGDIDGFGFWRQANQQIVLSRTALKDATLDLIVENCGRNTLGVNILKGITGDVHLNNERLTNWQITPLEFKKSWTNNLRGWGAVTRREKTSSLYFFYLTVNGTPHDTYIDMREWNKGIVMVNGFVLGRYFSLGPQQALYLPAPLLHTGNNVIIVFEHYNAPNTLKFTNRPIYQVVREF